MSVHEYTNLNSMVYSVAPGHPHLPIDPFWFYGMCVITLAFCAGMLMPFACCGIGWTSTVNGVNVSNGRRRFGWSSRQTLDGLSVGNHALPPHKNAVLRLFLDGVEAKVGELSDCAIHLALRDNSVIDALMVDGDCRIAGNVRGNVGSDQGNIHVEGDAGGNCTTDQGNIVVGGSVQGDCETGQGNVIVKGARRR